MISYTLFDFFLQSILMVAVGLLFWGLLIGLFAFVLYWLYERREKQQHQGKVLYPASWHKPGDLEDA